MEGKIEEHAAKIINLNETIKALRENDLKMGQEKKEERKENIKGVGKEATDNNELGKIKADILALKNEDIEKILREIQNLNVALRQLELEKKR